jgi:CBS-domain-containing membrane protein
VNESASLREAAAFLTEKDISASPVINEAGRLVGVVSLADIVRSACAEDLTAAPLSTAVKEVMTPVVYFVRPETPVETVIEDLLTCAVHRLFVVDEHDVLVGVISTVDVLRLFRNELNGVSNVNARRSFSRPLPLSPLDDRHYYGLEVFGGGSGIVMAGALN